MRDRPNDNHRRVLEAKLGRKLKPTEVGHHQDEDKSNNVPHNLEAQDRGEHTRMHNKNRPTSKLRAALRMVKDRKKSY